MAVGQKKTSKPQQPSQGAPKPARTGKPKHWRVRKRKQASASTKAPKGSVRSQAANQAQTPRSSQPSEPRKVRQHPPKRTKASTQPPKHSPPTNVDALWQKQILAAKAGRFRSGFVCLAGRPNAGKSTLLNRILGQKVSIATSRPQTTRNPVLGIWNQPDVQVVFVDTPGVHLSKHALGKRLVGYVKQSLRDADLILCVIDPMRGGGEEETTTLEWAKASGKPVWAVVNKIDALTQADQLNHLQSLQKVHTFAHLFPVSALTGKGVAALLEHITAHLQVGPPFFPPNQVTDQSLHTQFAERVREALFHRLYQEAPYGVAVQTEHVEKRNKLWIIHIRIYVERDSQKGLVIGKHGVMLKSIGIQARTGIQALLKAQVHLELHVSVLSQWSSNPRHLNALGLPEAR